MWDVLQARSRLLEKQKPNVKNRDFLLDLNSVVSPVQGHDEEVPALKVV